MAEKLDDLAIDWEATLAFRRHLFRYGLGGAEAQTLEEIGRRLGLTRERVRQIELESLRRLASLREMESVEAT